MPSRVDNLYEHLSALTGLDASYSLNDKWLTFLRSLPGADPNASLSDLSNQYYGRLADPGDPRWQPVSSVDYPEFDGDSPGWRWLGTPNASQSTGFVGIDLSQVDLLRGQGSFENPNFWRVGQHSAAVMDPAKVTDGIIGKGVILGGGETGAGARAISTPAETFKRPKSLTFEGWVKPLTAPPDGQLIFVALAGSNNPTSGYSAIFQTSISLTGRPAGAWFKASGSVPVLDSTDYQYMIGRIVNTPSLANVVVDEFKLIATY